MARGIGSVFTTTSRIRAELKKYLPWIEISSGKSHRIPKLITKSLVLNLKIVCQFPHVYTSRDIRLGMEDPVLHEFQTQDLVEKLGQNLQLIAEYDTETYNDLFVSDDVIDELGGEDAYIKQRKNIENFLRLDFIDRHAYGNIVPRAGKSNLFITQAATVLLVRLFVDENALFVSIERNGNIGGTIQTVESVVQ